MILKFTTTASVEMPSTFVSSDLLASIEGAIDMAVRQTIGERLEKRGIGAAYNVWTVREEGEE